MSNIMPEVCNKCGCSVKTKLEDTNACDKCGYSCKYMCKCPCLCYYDPKIAANVLLAVTDTKYPYVRSMATEIYNSEESIELECARGRLLSKISLLCTCMERVYRCRGCNRAPTAEEILTNICSTTESSPVTKPLFRFRCLEIYKTVYKLGANRDKLQLKIDGVTGSGQSGAYAKHINRLLDTQLTLEQLNTIEIPHTETEKQHIELLIQHILNTTEISLSDYVEIKTGKCDESSINYENIEAYRSQYDKYRYQTLRLYTLLEDK